MTRHRRARRTAALVATWGAAIVVTGCGRPVSSVTGGEVAWVAAGASVTLPGSAVTPVVLATRHRGRPVTVGSLPTGLAYTADDAGLLVTARGDDMLSEVDPATHAVVHSVPVGLEPDAVAVAPGGANGKGLALVANLDSDTVTPVDLGTWRAGHSIAVGHQPVAVAVYAPAGGPSTAFVADFGSDSVTPIDVATLQARPAIAVGRGPQALAVAASEVLVANFSDRSLMPIDAATLRPGAAVPLPLNPTGIAIAPSAATAYVCGGDALVSVTTLGLAVGTPVPLPGVAQGIALDRGGTTAWVTQQTGSVVPVALMTGSVGRPLRVGGHPAAIVIGAG